MDMETAESQSTPLEGNNAIFYRYLLDFARTLEQQVSDDERMELDHSAGEQNFVKDCLDFALRDPERFRAPLVELVKTLKVATGLELFDTVRKHGLYVDAEDNLVVKVEESYNVTGSRVG